MAPAVCTQTTRLVSCFNGKGTKSTKETKKKPKHLMKKREREREK